MKWKKCHRYYLPLVGVTRYFCWFHSPISLTRKLDSKFYFGLPNSNLQVMAGPLPPKQSSHTWRRSRHVTKCHFWQNIPKNEKRHVKQTPWHLTDQKKNVIFLWQQFWFFDLQIFQRATLSFKFMNESGWENIIIFYNSFRSSKAGVTKMIENQTDKIIMM